MFRGTLIFILALFFSIAVSAQADTVTTLPDNTPHLRISLITCGPGSEEVYEVFGHTAVRVIDSTHHLDIAFNYGTFEYGPDFELQFMRGKLLYSLSVADFHDFMQEYVAARRSVSEQVLNLSVDQEISIWEYLQNNYLPQNRHYKYDFFFDNCATRIRDIFPRSMGAGFIFGRTLPPGARMSYRDIINQYFKTRLWERMGVNILLGSKIDRTMSNEDIMFLPDYLSTGVGGGTYKGAAIASPVETILPAAQDLKPMFNWPFVLSLLLAVLTIAGLSMPRLALLGRIMSAFTLVVTGLLGVLILVMWFATDHQACSSNFNILWALPTNLIIAFARPKGRNRYSILAILLIFVSFLLHLLGIQKLLLLEFSPILLSLLYIYGSIYRKSKTPVTHNA